MNGITTAFSGRRGLALGAVVVLLLAALAGFGQQAAKAAITSAPTSVTVANVSPPVNGKIVYTLQWTEDSTADNYTLAVTNIANTQGCAGASLTISPAAAGVGSCTNLPFGSGISFAVTDNTNSGTITATVELQVVNDPTKIGQTVQPTFTLTQNSASVSVTAPARTIGAAAASASVSEAKVGDTVTFTFTLPPGWTCNSDGTVDDQRACGAGDLSSSPAGAITFGTPSLTGTSLYGAGTVTVTGTINQAGQATATLNVKYEGDYSVTGDDSPAVTDPSASVLVWLGIGGPTPALDFDGGATSYTVDVANLTGSNRSAGQATVKITLPAEFSSVSAPSPAPTGWSCSASGNDVTCTNTAPFITGGTAAFTVSGVLSGNTGAASRNITVQAQADFTVPPVGSTSRTASRTDSQPAAGLVTITANPTVLPSSASGVIQYTVSVNNGTGSSIPAADVSFEFKAPAGSVSTAVSVTPGSGWSCTVADAETVNCTRTAALPSGSTSVGTFVVQVPANTSATLVTRTATGTLSLTIGSATYQPQASANVLHPGTGATSVTYNLVLGWNLITWNGKNNVAVDSADGLGSISGSFTAVYTFDAATQTWRFWFPGGGAVNTIAGLEFGTAYFIYVTTPTSLTVPSGP